MDGYGCKAIHQALADAGMSVSKSTVQRHAVAASGSAGRPPWECWLTHAATAAVASAVTWLLAAYF